MQECDHYLCKDYCHLRLCRLLQKYEDKLRVFELFMALKSVYPIESTVVSKFISSCPTHIIARLILCFHLLNESSFLSVK